MQQLSLSQPGFVRISKLLNYLARWWVKEFLNLLPERYAKLFSERGRPRLVVSTSQEGILLELRDGAFAPTALERSASGKSILMEVDRLLLSRKLGRRDVDLGLRLPAQSVFGRMLFLPAEASGAIN